MSEALKSYKDVSVESIASAILTDIVRSGQSTGWDIKELKYFEDVVNILAKFNIYYVSDLDGRWEYVENKLLPKFSIGQHVYCSGPMNTIDHCVVEEIVIRQDVIAYRLNDGTTRAQENLYDSPECVIENKMEKVEAEIEKLEKELETLRKDRDEAIRYRYGKEG